MFYVAHIPASKARPVMYLDSDGRWTKYAADSATYYTALAARAALQSAATGGNLIGTTDADNYAHLARIYTTSHNAE